MTSFHLGVGLPDSPGFRKTWTAQAISQFGDAIYSIALPLIVYDATGSAADMSLVYGLVLVPHTLFGLVGGAQSDRHGPRRPLVAASLSAAAVAFAITVMLLVGHLDMAVLSVCTVALATASSMLLPAFEATIPRLVEPRDLLRANASLESVRIIAGAIGPVIAGLLVGAGDGAIAVGADALSFAVTPLLIRGVAGLGRTAPAPAVTDSGRDGAREPLRSQLRAGVAEVWSSPVLRPGVAVCACANVYVGLLEIYVIFALRRYCGVSSEDIGLIFFGTCVLAALLGAALSRRRQARSPQSQLALGLVGIAASCCLMVAQHSTPMVVGALILNVAASMLYNMCWRAVRQSACSPGTLGRVSGIARGISYLGAAAGAWAGGLLATFTGSGITIFFLSGALVLLLCGLGVRRVRIQPLQQAA